MVPADDGLINTTLMVLGDDGPVAVLQRVNPIFSPRICRDIAAVTHWLDAKGLVTPRLLPARDGGWSVDDEAGGFWRMQSFVPGRTVHTVSSPALARAAGALVGRFHAALADYPDGFLAPRRNVHDTQARMSDLRDALDRADGDPLEGPVRSLGQRILDDWAAWAGTLDQPDRPAHGDLKISNLRFHPTRDEGLCLLDLDTLGPLPLSVELGDAWRSWCNPAGESDPDAVRFDLDVFAASLDGWLSTAPALAPVERDNLVPGIERICLELSARFLADAVNRSYFREDRARWPEPGAHNLTRATAQHRLARAARDARAACEQQLRAGLDR
ncbi:MAG: aminoglycoside phosphotransferase family protein [Alphaproteobacteria bacterium]|nr:aminoglycoside phosphotransferase family protein [Alphaproteobacteria bacterium]